MGRRDPRRGKKKRPLRAALQKVRREKNFAMVLMKGKKLLTKRTRKREVVDFTRGREKTFHQRCRGVIRNGTSL